MTFVVCVDGLGLEPVAWLPTLWISSWHCSRRVSGTACVHSTACLIGHS